MRQEELDEVLRLHKLWLEGKPEGVKANLGGASLRGANLECANLVRANLSYAYLVGANLKGASLEGAYLEDANLEGANLECANLKGASLSYTNLRSANIEGAKLNGAYLEGTKILSFQGPRHFAFFHEGYLKIGCKGHSLEHWLKNYKETGKSEDYSEQEIRLYKMFIDLCAEANR